MTPLRRLCALVDVLACGWACGHGWWGWALLWGSLGVWNAWQGWR